MASKNIIAKGTTYNGVESVTFPTSPSGTATFYEVSDTTATASDVLNSKYFYTAAGVKTQGTGTAPTPTLITKNITQNGTYNASSDSADGYSSVTVNVSGGGGGDPWSWMGKNPTLVKNYGTTKVYLKNTGYATWTPATSATDIVASGSLEQYTGADFDNYDYCLLYEFHTHFEYGSGATDSAIITDEYCVFQTDIYLYPTSLAAITSKTGGSATANNTSLFGGMFYRSTTGVETYQASAAYGVYISATQTQQASLASGTITPATPLVKARCNNNYFSTANAAAVDQDASYFEYSVKIYRIDKDTSNVGYVRNHIRDMWLNGI